MKTKQNNLRAVFATCGKGSTHVDKPVIYAFIVTDKKTEKRVIDCRVYKSASANASTVYATLDVCSIADGVELNDSFIRSYSDGQTYKSRHTCGRGQAGGYGYCKASAAVQSAISSAGITLYGTPYLHHGKKPDFKSVASISGVGIGAVESALMAIAYAAGYKDCILTRV